MVGQKHGGMSFEVQDGWEKIARSFFQLVFLKVVARMSMIYWCFFSGHESNVKHMDQIIKLAVSLRVWKGAKKLFQGIFFL